MVWPQRIGGLNKTSIYKVVMESSLDSDTRVNLINIMTPNNSDGKNELEQQRAQTRRARVGTF